MNYYIYILRCENNKLYTGITTDYKRRFLEHLSSKKGAKFTKANKPKKIELLYKTDNRKNASKLEYHIKQLKKIDKEKLCIDNKKFKSFFFDKIDIKLYKRVNRIYLIEKE